MRHSRLIRFVTLIALAAWSTATAADDNATLRIDDFPCAEVATFPDEPADMTDKQLFYAAHAHDSGDCGQEDDAQALRYYKESARRGGQFAMIRIGYFYANGDGVTQDPKLARYWFRSFALSYPESGMGDRDGFVDTLFYGEPLPEIFLRELNRSRREYAGNPDVLMRNYYDLKSGNGVEVNPKRATIWLRRAMDLNHGPAHYERAQILQERQDINGYRLHLRLAAEDNDPNAQVELGKRYLVGDGIILWPYKALVWFYIAQAGGLDVAQLIIEAEAILDPLNIKHAREEAARFISDR